MTSAKKECVRLKSELSSLQIENERLRKEVFVHPNINKPILSPLSLKQQPLGLHAGNFFSSNNNLQTRTNSNDPYDSNNNNDYGYDVTGNTMTAAADATDDILERNPALLKLAANEKYKELNIRLRRLLTEERKALQTVS